MFGRVLRAAAAVAVVALSLTVFTGNALAAPYTANGVTISNSTPSPGETVTVSAGGFKPSSEVRIEILSDPVLLATPTADANGQVSADVEIPSSFGPGSQHTITFSGQSPSGSAYVNSIQITLAGGLAATGASSGLVALVAVALLGVGAAIVVGSRRRRRAEG